METALEAADRIIAAGRANMAKRRADHETLIAGLVAAGEPVTLFGVRYVPED